MTQVLSTDNLCRRFGSLWAVNNATFAIAEGEILALAGPNASGKTTLLRMLAGLLQPTSGEVVVLGRSPRQASAKVCYIGDGWELPPWITVALLAKLQAGAAPLFNTETYLTLCRSHGLGESDLYRRLSKGNRKWALFALAAAMPSKLLLLDEPADGLDPVARRELYNLVRKQATDCGTSVIVSTHILTDVERLADSVVLLDRGRIVLHAELEALREQVRLIETPASLSVTMPASAQCLRSTLSGERRLTWLRFTTGSLDDLEQQLGPDAIIRTVDLESLFIALFEPQGSSQELL